MQGVPLRGGFEIVDKSSRKGIYIEGALAEGFQRGVQAIVAQGPNEQALDDSSPATRHWPNNRC